MAVSLRNRRFAPGPPPLAMPPMTGTPGSSSPKTSSSEVGIDENGSATIRIAGFAEVLGESFRDARADHSVGGFFEFNGERGEHGAGECSTPDRESRLVLQLLIAADDRLAGAAQQQSGSGLLANRGADLAEVLRVVVRNEDARQIRRRVCERFADRQTGFGERLREIGLCGTAGGDGHVEVTSVGRSPGRCSRPGGREHASRLTRRAVRNQPNAVFKRDRRGGRSPCCARRGRCRRRVGSVRRVPRD